MATIAEVRAKYPQYSDLSDQQLADALHRKFYADMPRAEFDKRVGLSPEMNEPIDVEREKRISERADNIVNARSGALATMTEGGKRGMFENFADNIANRILSVPEAAVNALQGEGFDPGAVYSEMQEAQKRATDRLRENRPGAMLAGEILGGIGQAAILGGAKNPNAVLNTAAPTSAAGRVAESAGRAVQGFMAPASGGVLRQAAKGAAQGAVTGGLYTAGDDGDVLQGATVGGAIGGAIPLVSKAAGIVSDVAKNVAAPYIVPKRFAAGKVLERIDADGMTPQQVANRMAARPGTTIADVAGENVKGLVRTAVNVPGPARKRIIAQANIRQMAQGDRVNREVAAAFGDPQTWTDVLTDSVSKQKTVAGPLYQKSFAEAAPVDLGNVFKKIDEFVVPSRATGTPMAPDSISSQLMAIRNFLGNGQAQRVSLEDLHRFKSVDLSGYIDAAKRAGDKTRLRALVQVKNSLVDAMDAASTDYKSARAIFAGEAEVQDALEEGIAYVRSGAAVTGADVAKMSAAEKQAFRLGVARGLAETVDKAPDGADVVKRIFGSRSKRAILDPLFENATDKARFTNAMLNEARKTRTRQAVIGNTTTAMQQADQGDAGVVAEGVVNAITQGPGSVVVQILKRAGARLKGVTPQVADEIGLLAMSTNPADVQRAVGMLRARGVSYQQSKAAIDGIRRSLTNVGGQVGAMSATP